MGTVTASWQVRRDAKRKCPLSARAALPVTGGRAGQVRPSGHHLRAAHGGWARRSGSQTPVGTGPSPLRPFLRTASERSSVLSTEPRTLTATEASEEGTSASACVVTVTW